VYPCDCYNIAEANLKNQEQWQRLLEFSRIPPRYQSASLKPSGRSPHESGILPVCREFIDVLMRENGAYGDKGYRATGRLGGYPVKGIGLIGDVGVGKTYFTCAILLELMRKGIKCLFLDISNFYDEIKTNFNRVEPGSDDSDLIYHAKHTPVVVFDDVGAEYTTKWKIDELGKIINHRYNYNLVTIFTTNLSAIELAERIGARTVDRIREMTRAIDIRGESMRGKHGKDKE
jgi:hypothetical protein